MKSRKKLQQLDFWPELKTPMMAFYSSCAIHFSYEKRAGQGVTKTRNRTEVNLTGSSNPERDSLPEVNQ